MRNSFLSWKYTYLQKKEEKAIDKTLDIHSQKLHGEHVPSIKNENKLHLLLEGIVHLKEKLWLFSQGSDAITRKSDGINLGTESSGVL